MVRVLPIYLTNLILGFRTGFASFQGHTVAHAHVALMVPPSD